jgi:hypothetical protein
MGTFISIEVKGIKELQQKIGRIPGNVRKEFDAELAAVADDFVNRAQADAPTDQGILRNMITRKKEAPMEWKVVSGANWSAWIEFGTRSRVQIPSEFSAFASQFRGKGGGGQGFYDAILAWVKRKGITGTYSVKTKKRTGNKIDQQIEDEQTAHAIYLSILRHGIHPHPFFLKQIPIARAQIDQNINQVVARAFK